jgi:hypothetical protein
MKRPPFRSSKEMLCSARFRSLAGHVVTTPPRGPQGFRWRPWYTRAIHRNGYQEKQRASAFAMLEAFVVSRHRSALWQLRSWDTTALPDGKKIASRRKRGAVTKLK